MKLKHSVTCILMVAFSFMNAQELTDTLYETYKDYREPSLQKRRIKYGDIQPLIKKLGNNSLFHVQKVGESIEGRDLNLISLGDGATHVFLWSQMHGDEPTATQAIFDILNFFAAPEFKKEKALMLSELTLHFLPMLNPDGAELFQRRNALGIDINRDALRLQSPEGRTLKKVRDSLNPVFGFNLHDQSRYYNAEHTPKPATVSYLAPAFNYEKDINDIRGNAMRVIAFMNRIIQNYAPGQVGRYNDSFEPRAFGDNLTKWGTGVILIESGGYADDREKQEIRKLNYVSILSAIYTIANGSYADIALEEYEKIPRNDRKMFDLKLENVTYQLQGQDYILDLGIHRNEVDHEGHKDFYYKSVIADQGDLSTYYGYETFDASGYTIVAPKLTTAMVGGNNTLKVLQNGYAYLGQYFNDDVGYFVENQMKLNLWDASKELPEFVLKPGVNPTFFLQKDGKLTHAMINGFLLDLSKPLQDQKFGNALILR